CIGRVQEHLVGLGWPMPILADSGNGFHLLYRVDLPADDNGLVKAVLEALGDRFDTPAVTVDRKVFNPARIVKLYGTLARKGDHIEDRPHRWASLLETPDRLGIVPVEALKEAASLCPKKPVPTITTRRLGKSGFTGSTRA